MLQQPKELQADSNAASQASVKYQGGGRPMATVFMVMSAVGLVGVGAFVVRSYIRRRERYGSISTSTASSV
jgi:hypothetical protein